ncbi:hypothetical protein CKO44_06705 [Rubrivivax gelatinosus]|uniref:hypothetical protein n=1 Tax=Rubrivivax gelatinosus TaxID=28068 RepID=UPI001904EB43|nr:hypothetical protein [Rubrivivax gelatinosus]MBK1613162.1 hypothetical protein [Rubrivivax gelatinosus]
MALRAAPDWHEAAQTLVDGCCLLPDDEARVAWLEQLCRALGDPLYPAFLRVLCLVGEQGEAAAQRAVAATLNQALASGRLPAGPQAAWGAPGGGALRRQGPIEFLCARYLQPSGTLSASAFDRAARALLGLMAQDAGAHARYRARLEAAAQDPLEGAWSRADRAALQALAAAWVPGAAPGAAVDAFLQAARAGSGGLAALPGFAAFGPPGRR